MADLAIAVDLGGTHVRAGLVRRSGELIRRAAAATMADSGPEAVTAQIGELVASVATGVALETIAGVGVASPGPIDTERGVTLGIPTLAGFEHVPFRAMLQQRIGLPVWLENDGIAAALGEWRFGAGRALRTLIYVTVSTGIGGGIVMDGRLMHGRQGLAGHIGHMVIMHDGERCACGNRGCWEAYASGTAFAQRAQRRAAGAATVLGSNGAPVDGRAIFAAAAAGDVLARDLVAEEAAYLGTGIVSLLHLFSPEMIILGGGIAHGFDQLQPGIAARIAVLAMPAFRPAIIARAELGENSGLTGAAALVFDAGR